MIGDWKISLQEFCDSYQAYQASNLQKFWAEVRTGAARFPSKERWICYRSQTCRPTRIWQESPTGFRRRLRVRQSELIRSGMSHPPLSPDALHWGKRRPILLHSSALCRDGCKDNSLFGLAGSKVGYFFEAMQLAWPFQWIIIGCWNHKLFIILMGKTLLVKVYCHSWRGLNHCISCNEYQPSSNAFGATWTADKCLAGRSCLVLNCIS